MKAGAFRVVDGAAEAWIYVEAGEIVHARAGDLSGEEAFFSLVTWSGAEATFLPGELCKERSIARPTVALLADALRRVEEWKVVTRKLPSLTLVPEFVVQSVNTEEEDRYDRQISLNRFKWLVISKVDGQRDIRGVAAACRMPVEATAKVLYGLVAANLLRVTGEAGDSASRPHPLDVVRQTLA
jgi:hypothetical protein